MALLRIFYADEREERECEWLDEAVRRATELPLKVRTYPDAQTANTRKSGPVKLSLRA